MAKKKENKVYSIRNLSEKQLKVIEDALEMYTRLYLLQFEKVIDHLFNWNIEIKVLSDGYLENRDIIESLCFKIKENIVSKDEEMSEYPKNSHWSLGIGSPKTSIKSQIAYEIEKEIEKVLRPDIGRGSLDLTDEIKPVVKEDDLRKEKLTKIIDKLNNGRQ